MINDFVWGRESRSHLEGFLGKMLDLRFLELNINYVKEIFL